MSKYFLFTAIISKREQAENSKIYNDLERFISSNEMYIDTIVSLGETLYEDEMKYRIHKEYGKLTKSDKQKVREWAENHPLISVYKIGSIKKA